MGESGKKVFSEEPERLISYLDVEKIAASDNPQEELSRQFTEKFSQKAGWNLLKETGTNELRKLFENNIVQNAIEKEKKEKEFDSEQAEEFWKERDKELVEKQKELEKTIEKPFKEVRDGKIVARPKPFNWTKNIKTGEKTERYNNFLLQRKDYTNYKKLAWEFNDFFKTKQSYKSLRDHRQRLLGLRKGERKLG